MKLNVSLLEDGIKVISLQGRMDIVGTEEIGIPLTANIASETSNVVIDMSGIEFIASIGIGLIAGAANALIKRQGKLVLMNPQPIVRHAIETTAITKVIPIVPDIVSARSYLEANAIT
jgi:anti-sigma B factor antagonist